MRLRIATIRLAALVVLLTSFCDYWAYDRFDPAAPMNASGPEALAGFDLPAPSSAGFCSANLPDDDCICCSPLVARHAPAVPRPAFDMPFANELACAVDSGELTAPAKSTWPPSPGPAGSVLPLRV
jgi:hypothetical protein